MGLINADKVIDVIESTVRRYHVNYFGELSKGAGHYGPTLYKAEDVYEAIKGMPKVDAIPIEWIEQYVKSKTALLGDSELWMKWMIDDWEKEQGGTK